MATPMSAATFYGDLKDLLPGKVKTYQNWTTHNRGKRGDGWGPVHGVMVHHSVTASNQGAVDLCRRGYDGLPGPLYPIVVDKAGMVHLVGWDRCNHAGLGDDDVLQAVKAERYPLPKPNETNTDGNARFYGICLLNWGNGKDEYTSAQLHSAATAAALLCGLHGSTWTEKSVIGHKEWQKGKVDPTYSMGSFRRRVAGKLTVVRKHLREC